MSRSDKAYLVDFSHPIGEASLVPPRSPQWRVFKNPVAMAVGGVAAVLLEFADPRIRSGVWDHSTFTTDPIARSQRTGMAAMVGVFGPASAARKIIAGVNQMHRKVVGHTPDGEPYTALTPELLDWVSATAGYCFLEAYHRFVAPVSAEDRLRYYRDGEVVSRLYGVQNPLTSDADFLAMLDRLFSRFEPHEINSVFLDIVVSGRAAPEVPRVVRKALVRAAVSILPPGVRMRLQLGSQFDLRTSDILMTRAAGCVAERVRTHKSPPWQAAIRLGLPGNFAWLSSARQEKLLAERTGGDGSQETLKGA